MKIIDSLASGSFCLCTCVLTTVMERSSRRGRSSREERVEFPSMLQTGARGLMGKGSALDATDPGSGNSEENVLVG